MRMHGRVKLCTVSTQELSDNGFPHRGYGSFLKDELREYRAEEIHYTQNTENQSKTLLGLSALDGDSHHDLFCLFLMSTDWEEPILPAQMMPEYGSMTDSEQL
jgi:hypothetical protein